MNGLLSVVVLEYTELPAVATPTKNMSTVSVRLKSAHNMAWLTGREISVSAAERSYTDQAILENRAKVITREGIRR